MDGAADVMRRANTIGCRSTGNASQISPPVSATIARAVVQPRLLALSGEHAVEEISTVRSALPERDPKPVGISNDELARTIVGLVHILDDLRPVSQ